MAAPLVQDSTTICTEAYRLVGINTPSSTQVLRAQNYFLEQAKNDIWLRAGETGNNRFKSLQSAQVIVSKVGISNYSLTSEFNENIYVALLTGTTPRDVNSNGSTAATCISLSSCEDSAVDDIEGKYLLIVASSTGAETELHQITDYSTATFLATINSSFISQPAENDDYVIVDEETILDEENLLVEDSVWSSLNKGEPDEYMITWENGQRMVFFDKPFDNDYTGILVRFYADINRLDTTGNVMNNIYQTWKDTLILGVAKRVALDEDDSKYDVLSKDYERSIDNLIKKELVWGGEWEGFTI